MFNPKRDACDKASLLVSHPDKGGRVYQLVDSCGACGGWWMMLCFLSRRYLIEKYTRVTSSAWKNTDGMPLNRNLKSESG